MAAYGNLLISTYLSNQSIPLSDSFISVTKTENGKEILLSLRTTDENGKAEVITLPTPEKEYSEAPEDEFPPFSSVNVKIFHPNTVTYETDGVQIFAGETSILNIMMIPLSENQLPSENVKPVIIKPQNL